jgi:hypothetical protein
VRTPTGPLHQNVSVTEPEDVIPRVKVVTNGGDEIKMVATAVAKTPSDHVVDQGRTEGIADDLGRLQKRFTAPS